MTAKPTAVVVRLPLSGEDCMTIRKHITSKCLTNDGIVNGIRAIGTPVAGGELEAVGYVPGEDIPLVRQSDAQAALAAAQAENMRLRDYLETARSYLTEAPSVIARRGALDVIEEALKGPEA